VERYAESQAGNEVPGIRNFASWVPESLERIVTMALRHRADERYANVVEMQRDLVAIEAQVAEIGGSALGGALRKSEPSGRPSSPSQPPTTGRRASVTALPRVPGRMAPRRSRAVPLLAAVLAACLAGAAVLLYSEGVFDSLFGGSGSGATDAATAGPATGGPLPPSAVQATSVPDAAEAVRAAGAGTTVRISVSGVPDGGRVRIGDVPLEQAPFELAVPRSDQTLVVVVEADGYRAFRAEVVPSADRAVEARLERSATRPGGGRPGGNRPADGGSDGGRRDAGTRPAFVDNPFR